MTETGRFATTGCGSPGRPTLQSDAHWCKPLQSGSGGGIRSVPAVETVGEGEIALDPSASFSMLARIYGLHD